jgi:hypothetical protein
MRFCKEFKMTVETATVRNQLVMRDDSLTWRWFDAFGPNVVKWELDMVTLAQDASANPAGYTTTEAGTNTIVLQQSTDRGELLLTCGGTENNGIQIQPLGEAFYFANRYPAYFGCRFEANDVDQVDVLVGLVITDTSAIAACSDGIYFRSVDEAATIQFILEKDSAETSNSAGTLEDGTKMTVEFYYDGADYIYAYVDGTLQATVARTDTSFPNDEHLTPTIAILTGENTANTMTISWCRAIQIYE